MIYIITYHKHFPNSRLNLGHEYRFTLDFAFKTCEECDARTCLILLFEN